MRWNLCLLLAVLAGCGSRTPGAVEPVAVESSTPTDLQADISGRIEEFKQAYELHSVEALAPLYAQDLDVVINVQGVSYRGWSDVLAYLQKRLEGATAVRLVLKDITIRGIGSDGAVAHARVEFNIGDDATTVTERGVITFVFARIDDAWLIVGEHFSYPPRGA